MRTGLSPHQPDNMWAYPTGSMPLWCPEQPTALALPCCALALMGPARVLLQGEQISVERTPISLSRVTTITASQPSQMVLDGQSAPTA